VRVVNEATQVSEYELPDFVYLASPLCDSPLPSQLGNCGCRIRRWCIMDAGCYIHLTWILLGNTYTTNV
jgi:hypothetical protein